jgi:hypothetical protein
VALVDDREPADLVLAHQLDAWSMPCSSSA